MGYPLPFRRRAVKFACLSLLVLAGCKDKRRHEAAQDVDFGSDASTKPAAATPQEAAVEFAHALADVQHSRADGFANASQREAYDRALSHVRDMIAGDSIHRALMRGDLRSNSLPRNVDEKTLVTALAESWVSLLAHYADGIQDESARVMSTQTSDGEDEATIKIQAVPPGEATRFREVFDSSMPPNAPAASYSQESRSKAVTAGFNLPIGATILIKLRRRPEGPWLVSYVALEPLTAGRPDATLSSGELPTKATTSPSTAPAG